MFKTVKRIINWCGEFKGKLYLGFVMTFFSHIFAALPLGLAAYTVGKLIESQASGTAFDTSWIWKSIIIQIVLVFFRFLFDYFRARLQESISYQLTARDRLAVGDALKRVSLGYFGQVSTGNILSSITTGLSTLENMGIRMIDNFVGGYLNFLVIFIGLALCSPVTALIALAAVWLYAHNLTLQLRELSGRSTGKPRYDRSGDRICPWTVGCEILWQERCSYEIRDKSRP